MTRSLITFFTSFLLSVATTATAQEYIHTVPWAERAYKNKDYETAARGFTIGIQEMERRGETARKNFELREYKLKRAGAYLNIGKQDAAATEIVNLLKNDEININGIWQGHLKAVIGALTHHLRKAPNDAAVLKWRGIAYDASSKHQEAIADYTRLFELAKTPAEQASALALRSWPLRLVKKSETALADLTAAIALDPTPARYITRSYVFGDLGQVDNAIEDVTSALQLVPQSDKKVSDWLRHRAGLNRRAKRFKKALGDLDHSLELDPANIKTKALRIVVLHQAGNLERTRGELLALRKADPRFFAKPYGDIKPLIEQFKAEELTAYMVPDRAGRNWKMAQIATTTPLLHMVGKETAKTRQQWASLSKLIEKEAAGHPHLPQGGLAPIPDFSDAGNQRLRIALEFISRQTDRMARVFGAKDGDPARAIVALSSVTSQIRILNRLGVSGSGKRFSGKAREAVDILSLPKAPWERFLKAAEADDRNRVRAEWPDLVRGFSDHMKANLAKVTEEPSHNVTPKAVDQRIRVSHILVETESEALRLIGQLKKGAAFPDLARKFSRGPDAAKGGDLGFFGRGQMVAEFEEAAFSLNVGEISGPVKTKFGWHVILMVEKKS